MCLVHSDGAASQGKLAALKKAVSVLSDRVTALSDKLTTQVDMPKLEECKPQCKHEMLKTIVQVHILESLLARLRSLKSKENIL